MGAACPADIDCKRIHTLTTAPDCTYTDTVRHRINMQFAWERQQHCAMSLVIYIGICYMCVDASAAQFADVLHRRGHHVKV